MKTTDSLKVTGHHGSAEGAITSNSLHLLIDRIKNQQMHQIRICTNNIMAVKTSPSVQ